MALKKCKECSQEIAKSAKTCPGCGAPNGAKNYSSGKFFLYLILVGILANLILSSIDGPPPQSGAKKHTANTNNMQPSAPPPIAKPDEGDWLAQVEKNPLDDTKTVMLYLKAKQGKGKFGETIALILQCKSNTTDMYIRWGDYLGSEAYVTDRIGDKPAARSEWSLSTDSQATFAKKPIGKIKELMKSDQYIAQVTPYNENPSQAAFNTKGLTQVIKPLRETCKW